MFSGLKRHWPSWLKRKEIPIYISGCVKLSHIHKVAVLHSSDRGSGLLSPLLIVTLTSSRSLPQPHKGRTPPCRSLRSPECTWRRRPSDLHHTPCCRSLRNSQPAAAHSETPASQSSWSSGLQAIRSKGDISMWKSIPQEQKKRLFAMDVLCWRPSRSRIASDPWHQWRIPYPSSQQWWAAECPQPIGRKRSPDEARKCWRLSGSLEKWGFCTPHCPGQKEMVSLITESIQSALRCSRWVTKIAETSTCAYHVCKLSHAQTIGLDALVGQDVVHQHQFAVVEPDLHALGLLWWGSVGPSWKVRNRYSCEDSRESQTGWWDSPNFSFQAWNSISSRETLAQLATARRAAAATSSNFILTENACREEADRSEATERKLRLASAVSSWHSLSYLCLSIAPFSSSLPTAQEVCTPLPPCVCVCDWSYLPLCVRVPGIQVVDAKLFFYTQPPLWPAACPVRRLSAAHKKSRSVTVIGNQRVYRKGEHRLCVLQ